jgi:plastocyanin
MKLLPFILFSGVGSLAAVIVNPFAELVCFNPPQTTASVTTTAPSIPLSSSSSGWVTTNDGLVTSCNFNGANSTIWIFPTGSGNHEATKATCEGSSIVTITFVEVVVQIVKNQTTTIIPTGEGPTHSSLAPSIIEATSSSSSSLIAPTQSAATHLVNIGGDGGLVFSHSQLNASIGDTVRFNFLGNNHSVTQSDLGAPCTYNGGFDSGFNLKNTSGNFTADFAVNTSAPLWFYS